MLGVVGKETLRGQYGDKIAPVGIGSDKTGPGNTYHWCSEGAGLSTHTEWGKITQ